MRVDPNVSNGWKADIAKPVGTSNRCRMKACSARLHTVLVAATLVSACSDKFSADNVFPNGPARSIAHMAEKNALPQQLAANLKAHINDVGRYGLTPLLWSVKDDNVSPETIGVLVKNGADEFYYSETQRTSSILHSLTYGPLDEFTAIVKNSRDINRFQDKNQRDAPTILFSAVMNGNLPKVELLIRSGAKIEVRNDLGQTPLLYALPGNLSTIMALLRAGADPKAHDRNGNGICESLSHVTNPARQKELVAVRKQLTLEGVNCGSSDSSL